MKLERLLVSLNYPHVDRDIRLLRNIYSVRSMTAAHRRSNKFDPSKVGLTLDNHFINSYTFLDGAARMLSDLAEYVEGNRDQCQKIKGLKSVSKPIKPPPRDSGGFGQQARGGRGQRPRRLPDPEE